MVRLLTAQEGLDNAHAATAAGARMLGRYWLLLGPDVCGLDRIDWNEWKSEQCADACNDLCAGLAGEPTVVADAEEALLARRASRNELVGIERHDLISLGSFNPIILMLWPSFTVGDI
jgi:hypothetical protein